VPEPYDAVLLDLVREVTRQERPRFAVIQTDYFGGMGGQWAAAFDAEVRVTPDGSTINRALEALGVRATATEDAFDVVGLGTFRHNPDHLDAYVALHELGWAHSVETWSGGQLVGGVYGVAIGGLFAAESKFHRTRDASKVALVALVDVLRAGRATLLDVQWTTPHLASLGAVDIARDEYLRRLDAALQVVSDPWNG